MTGHRLPLLNTGTDRVPPPHPHSVLSQLAFGATAMDDKLLTVCDLTKPPKSLLAWVCGIDTWDWATPALGGAGATKL